MFEFFIEGVTISKLRNIASKGEKIPYVSLKVPLYKAKELPSIKVGTSLAKNADILMNRRVSAIACTIPSYIITKAKSGIPISKFHLIEKENIIPLYIMYSQQER